MKGKAKASAKKTKKKVVATATRKAAPQKKIRRLKSTDLGEMASQALRLVNGDIEEETMTMQTKNSLQATTVEGELTIYTVQAVKKSMEQWVDNDTIDSADLSGVTEIDTAGVQLLIAVMREKAKHHIDFRLVNCSRAVLDVFDLYRMKDFMKAS